MGPHALARPVATATDFGWVAGGPSRPCVLALCLPQGMEEVEVQFPLALSDIAGQRPAVFLFSGVGVESECGYAPRVGGLVYKDLVHNRLPEVVEKPINIQRYGPVPKSFG